VTALVTAALQLRPEILEQDARNDAAEAEVKAEHYSLLLPRVSLSYSSGDFGGGPGSSVPGLRDRDDLAVQFYWQFDQLGFGQRGRMDQKRSQLRQLELEQSRSLDVITAEVRAAVAELGFLKERMALNRAAEERAARAFALNRERIFENEGLPLEALQAMQKLAQIELADLDYALAFSLAQIRLHTAIGNPLAVTEQ
jgi:outer membrane protein TolC